MTTNLIEKARKHVKLWGSPTPVHHTSWANDAADLLPQLIAALESREDTSEKQRGEVVGELPPLLTDERIERIAKTLPLEGCDQQKMCWGIGYTKESDFLEPNVPVAALLFARAVESEVRAALAQQARKPREGFVEVPVGERAGWYAVAMNAAAALEDAANCLRDSDAQKAAAGAATHVRQKCNSMWLAARPKGEGHD